MAITDPNTVATWVDLFLPMADALEHTIYDEEVPPPSTITIRGSVHRWTKHFDPTDLPSVSGETEVAGTGGIKRLQPLVRNSFANLGGRESKVDSGVLRFTVNFLGSVGPGPALYGVHFNSEPGNGAVGRNTGFAVLLNSSQGFPTPDRLVIRRVDLGDTGGSTFLDVETASDGDLPFAIVLGTAIEVRWSQTPQIFGQPDNANIAVYLVEPGGDPVEVLTHQFEPGDTSDHVQGGLFGVCAWEPGANLGTSGAFITRFEYRNVIQPLSKYVEAATGEGLPYRSTFGGLYEDPDRGFSNEVPDDYEGYGRSQADAVMPLDADGKATDDLDGRIGFVSLGVSTSGHIFNAFLRMANDNEFLDQEFGARRNALLTIVNCCRAGSTVSGVAGQGAAHGLWTTAVGKLMSAGLAVTDADQLDWKAFQVQVVWLNLADIIGADDAFNVDGAASGSGASMAANLNNIRGQLLDHFPNLKLVLCSDYQYMGWANFADQVRSEPNMAESLRFGYRGLIRDTITVFREQLPPALPVPWVGWLGELFGNIDVWREHHFPRDNPGHPNAQGEEAAARLMLLQLFRHFTTDFWWTENSVGLVDPSELFSVPALDNASVRNYFPNYPRSSDAVSVETLSHKGFSNVVAEGSGAEFEGPNHREKVYVKFALPPLISLRQVLLQLHYWSQEDYDTATLGCTVRIADSLDKNGKPWDGNTLTWETAPDPLGLTEAESPSDVSIEHPISIDVTAAVREFLKQVGGPVVTFEVEPRDLAEGVGQGAEGAIPEQEFRWHSIADRLTNPVRSPQLVSVGEPLERPGAGAHDRMRPGRRER